MYAFASRAAAQNPNTRPEELLRLVHSWPDEVLQNPVLPLLLLEDPSQGVYLRDSARCSRAERDIRCYAAEATLRTRRAWLVASISRVLLHFESLHPEDKRPRYTLELISEAGRLPMPRYVWRTALRTKANHSEPEHARCYWTSNAVAFACTASLNLHLQAASLASQVAQDPLSEREWQANEIEARVRVQYKKEGPLHE